MHSIVGERCSECSVVSGQGGKAKAGTCESVGYSIHVAETLQTHTQQAGCRRYAKPSALSTYAPSRSPGSSPIEGARPVRIRPQPLPSSMPKEQSSAEQDLERNQHASSVAGMLVIAALAAAILVFCLVKARTVVSARGRAPCVTLHANVWLLFGQALMSRHADFLISCTSRYLGTVTS